MKPLRCIHGVVTSLACAQCCTILDKPFVTIKENARPPEAHGDISFAEWQRRYARFSRPSGTP